MFIGDSAIMRGTEKVRKGHSGTENGGRNGGSTQYGQTAPHWTCGGQLESDGLLLVNFPSEFRFRRLFEADRDVFLAAQSGGLIAAIVEFVRGQRR